MLGKVGPGKIFLQRGSSSDSSQNEEEQVYEFQDSKKLDNVRVDEILVGGIPSPQRDYVYQYINIKGDNPSLSNDSTLAKSSSS